MRRLQVAKDVRASWAAAAALLLVFGVQLAHVAQTWSATWDEPGASDVYVKAADSLVQLAVSSGDRSIDISGDILPGHLP